MFRDRDLALRLLGTALPARLGHRLGAELTLRLGGERFRHAGAVAAAAATALLGDAAGAAVGRRFVASLAGDDLDACRLWAGVAPTCADAVCEGERFLPAGRAALFVGFHLSGGLAVLEVLRQHGFAPTLLRAPVPRTASRYARAIDYARLRYLERVLERPWIETGPGARDALGTHLAQGGSVIGLIDVPPAAIELRDRAPATLLGRDASLPCGLLRLALAHRLPVVPFDVLVADGRRTVRFHPVVHGEDVATLLAGAVRTLEGVVRERPWDWHAWLEIDYLLGGVGAERAAGG